jgi:hypothetical protein
VFSTPIDRRRFLSRAAAGVGALATGLAGCDDHPEPGAAPLPPGPPDAAPAAFVGPRPRYRGPNVIVVRFGGGVRRRETVQFPDHTFCPFITHELAGQQGVLFNNVEIASQPGIDTSHGQGTLYLLTGRYDHYEDITHKPFAERFEAKVPTVFEYLRKTWDIPEHQALIVNGEDRINEEFYTFSNHHLFGVHYRSTVLSLYRFKTYLLRRELKERDLPDKGRAAKEKKLRTLEAKDYRVRDLHVASPPLDAFWEGWRQYYGQTGLVNPRGDRVLTALALRALNELRPRLLMINYQDPDYVHWGNATFYTRALSIIDEGVREIYHAVQADEGYRDNTVFVVVPDCGRDNNRGMAVPFQHHFNSKSSHEIFAVLAGPRKFLPHARRTHTGLQQQISVAATVGEVMGFPTPHADAPSLLKTV